MADSKTSNKKAKDPASSGGALMSRRRSGDDSNGGNVFFQSLPQPAMPAPRQIRASLKLESTVSSALKQRTTLLSRPFIQQLTRECDCENPESVKLGLMVEPRSSQRLLRTWAPESQKERSHNSGLKTPCCIGESHVSNWS